MKVTTDFTLEQDYKREEQEITAFKGLKRIELLKIKPMRIHRAFKIETMRIGQSKFGPMRIQ